MNKEIKERFESLDHNYLGLKPRDGGAFYLIAFIFMWLAQLAIMLVIMLASGDPDSENTLKIGNYVANVVTPFVFALTPLMYCKIANKSYLSAFRFERKPNIKLIGLAVAITVLCIVTFAPIATGFIELVKLTGYKPQDSIMERGVGNFFLQILLLAILPAIGEEILFRGFVARSFKAKSYMFAVILSGFFFAIFHGSPVQLVHQMLLGMVLAFVYFASGSIYIAVGVHFLNNLLAISMQHIEYLMYPEGTAVATMPIGATVGIYIAMVIVGGILLYIALRAFLRESKRQKGINVDKISTTAWLNDFAKAFYPKGIKENWSKLNNSLKLCFDDPTDEYNNAETPVDEHVEVKDEELRQRLIELDKETKRKGKIRDRNIVVMSGALVMVVWIFNLVSNIVKG